MQSVSISNTNFIDWIRGVTDDVISCLEIESFVEMNEFDDVDRYLHDDESNHGLEDKDICKDEMYENIRHL